MERTLAFARYERGLYFIELYSEHDESYQGEIAVSSLELVYYATNPQYILKFSKN